MPIDAENALTQRSDVVQNDLSGNHGLFDLMVYSCRGVLTRFGVTDPIDPENPSNAAISRIQEVIQPLAANRGIQLTRASLLRVATAIHEQGEESMLS